MKLNIAVFFGGKSTEHEISCISANQAIHALNSDKYNVIPVYISRNNEMYTGDLLFDLANYSDFINNPDSKLSKVYFYKDNNKTYMSKLKKGLFNNENTEIDVAFPVVHGTNVEDGSLAGFLEMLDLPYTSCDVLGGAVGQDKAVMKDIFLANDLPMVEHFIVYGYDFLDNYDAYFKQAKKLGFPLIAKPANLGSSIGIEVIKTQKEFKDKINDCLKYDFKIVVEKMVEDLKEVNISCIGNLESVKLSAIEEVTNGFLDFDKKYMGGAKGSKKLPSKASKGMASTNRKVPADLTKKQEEQIREVASKAYRVLNSHGCVRIDFMIDNKTGKVYINEINTIPGSLSFYLWKEVGLDFETECDELIKNALSRYAAKQKKTYSFNTTVLDNYRRKK